MGDIALKAETVIVPILAGLGFNLVDCEYTNEHGRWILRLYVERPDGNASVEDCMKVTRSLEGTLEVEGIVPGRYTLEVSSPGLDRPLRTARDFERFIGQMVRIRTKEPLNGRGNFYGTLIGINGTDITVKVDGLEYKVPLDKVSKARLEYK